MAERTLVAYDRDDGYDLHYAHDGVDSAALTPATPFEGPAERDIDRLRERLATLGIDIRDPDTGTAVDPAPLAWERVVAELDYAAYNRCLRVATDWTVDRYLVCTAGLEDRLGRSGAVPVGDGTLISVGAGEAAYAAGWFEGVKSGVVDAVGCGVFAAAAARSYLTDHMRALAGVDEHPTYVGF